MNPKNCVRRGFLNLTNTLLFVLTEQCLIIANIYWNERITSILTTMLKWSQEINSFSLYHCVCCNVMWTSAWEGVQQGDMKLNKPTQASTRQKQASGYSDASATSSSSSRSTKFPVEPALCCLFGSNGSTTICSVPLISALQNGQPCPSESCWVKTLNCNEHTYLFVFH